MLVALKLLVVLGALSYALAALLGEREVVATAGPSLAAAASVSAAAAARSAFQPPLSHYIRRPRLPHQHDSSSNGGAPLAGGGGGGGGAAGDGGSLPLGRPQTCRTESTLYSKKQGPLTLQRSLRHRTLPGGSVFEFHDSKTITTVDGLRVKHGPGSFWGDLNHVETRLVYHQLLPRHLLEDARAHGADQIAVEDLARLASMARHAARLYARERSSLPLRLLAGLYDGFRHLQTFGRWSWTGMTYEEVWAKYEAKVREELLERHQGTNNNHVEVDRQELNRLVALRILQKSCETNPGFDRFTQVEKAKAILAHAASRGVAREQARIQRALLHTASAEAQGLAAAASASSSSSSSSSSDDAAAAAKAETSAEADAAGVASALSSWAAKKSPLLPLLEHFARLGQNMP